MKALTALLLLTAANAAAEAGRTGSEFLRIMTSPRATGMGEAGVALSDDLLGGVSLNPAGLGRLAYTEAAFTYNQLYNDLSLQHLSLAHPTSEWGTFAVSGTMLRSESISGYDNSGGQTASVEAQDIDAGAFYAHRLAGPHENRALGLFGGAGVRYVRSALDTVRSAAVMGDAGALYAGALGPGTFSAGASARSFGQGARFDSQRELPPTVYRAGLGYSMRLLGDPFTVAYDARRPQDHRVSHGVGLEYLVRGVLAWRLGYSSGQDFGSGFRFGVGFKLKVITVDYALSHYGDYGVTHLVGLSARFGAPLDRTPALSREEERAADHVRRGKAKLRERRAYEAALEFNEALRLDPHNKEALRLLREVREGLEGAR